MKRSKRGDEQFIVRMPRGMRGKIKKLAARNGRSMTAEVIAAIDAHLQGHGQSVAHGIIAAIEYAKLMAESGPIVPEELRKKPGVCLAVVLEAQERAAQKFRTGRKAK